MKYECFWKLKEAAANPLLMVWNLQEIAVKLFAHFSIEILILWNFREAVVKAFA